MSETEWDFDKILLKPGSALREINRLREENARLEADQKALLDVQEKAAQCISYQEATINGQLEVTKEVVYVPGQWQCDACSFSLYQRTLNAADGTVSARDTQPEPCPNCNTMLRRVTWQERAYQAEDMLADAYDQRNKALASQTPAVNNFIAKAAQLATDLGWQAGEPASELAGQIISVLAAHPEHTDRFLEEGGELFIDGTFDTANGSLTYRSRGGDILHPTVLRAQKGNLQ